MGFGLPAAASALGGGRRSPSADLGDGAALREPTPRPPPLVTAADTTRRQTRQMCFQTWI